jgi:hypothetical protein
MNVDQFNRYLQSFIYPPDASNVGLFHPELSKRLDECTKEELNTISDSAIHGMIKRMVRYLAPVWEDSTLVQGLMVATRPFGIRMHTKDVGYINNISLPESCETFGENMKRVFMEKLSSIFSSIRNETTYEYTFHKVMSPTCFFRIQFRSDRAVKNFTELIKTPI